MRKILISLLLINFFFILNNPSLASNLQGDTITQTSELSLSDSSLEDNETVHLSDQDGSSIAQSGSVIPESEKFSVSFISLLRGLLGMVVLIFIAFVFSTNRKEISWKVVVVGLSIQIFLAIGILYIPIIRKLFEFAGRLFVLVLDFTKAGSEFLFGSLLDMDKMGMIFAFQILPTVVFF